MNINNEVLQKLIKGSQNIDRMREEIDLVINGVLGLIHKPSWSGKPSSPIIEEIKIDDRVWTIQINVPNGRVWKDDLIACTVPVGNHMIPIYSTLETECSCVRLENVQMIYGDLPKLVNWIAYRLSDLEPRLQHLLNAAEVFA